MHGMISAAVRSAAIATVAVAAVGAAQPADVALPTGPVMAFDIAGVRLGMSAVEARDALVRKSYVVAPQQSYSYV